MPDNTPDPVVKIADLLILQSFDFVHATHIKVHWFTFSFLFYNSMYTHTLKLTMHILDHLEGLPVLEM